MNLYNSIAKYDKKYWSEQEATDYLYSKNGYTKGQYKKAIIDNFSFKKAFDIYGFKETFKGTIGDAAIGISDSETGTFKIKEGNRIWICTLFHEAAHLILLKGYNADFEDFFMKMQYGVNPFHEVEANIFTYFCLTKLDQDLEDLFKNEAKSIVIWKSWFPTAKRVKEIKKKAEEFVNAGISTN